MMSVPEDTGSLFNSAGKSLTLMTFPGPSPLANDKYFQVASHCLARIRFLKYSMTSGESDFSFTLS